MAFHTFGPGLALDKITTRGLSTVTAKVEDADTGEPLQAYTMDDPATPTQITTNRYGYFPEFRAPDTARRIRLTFGNLALDQIAHESIGAAADSLDLIENVSDRLESVEVLGGLAPGDTSDATVKSHIINPASQTSAALSAAISEKVAPVEARVSDVETLKLDKTEAAATYATNASVTTEIAVRVDPLVADAIAADRAVADAAAAAVSAAVTNGNYRMPGRYAKVTPSGALPNFTNAGVMTYPDGLRVISGRDYYTVAPGTLDFSSTASAVSLTLILFDPDTNLLVAVAVTSLNATHQDMLLVATFHNVVGRGRSAWMNCPFTFNGAYLMENENELLHADEVPGANIVPTFNASGDISEIRHQIGGTTIRYDQITYSATQIVQTRQHLPTGKTITLTTNLTTLVTEVS